MLTFTCSCHLMLRGSQGQPSWERSAPLGGALCCDRVRRGARTSCPFLDGQRACPPCPVHLAARVQRPLCQEGTLLLLCPVLLAIPGGGGERCGHHWLGVIELVLLCKLLDSL